MSTPVEPLSSLIGPARRRPTPQVRVTPGTASGLPSCSTSRPAAACPVCGGQLVEIRHKLICSRCHAICETCCEGGRG